MGFNEGAVLITSYIVLVLSLPLSLYALFRVFKVELRTMRILTVLFILSEIFWTAA